MIIHNVKQNTPEWLNARLGIPSASEFHRIVSPTGKLSSQSDAYMHRLLAEWILGVPLEDPQTQWMERGHDLEDQAVRAYEFATDCTTETVGFITTDDGMIGASPDRIVGTDGLLEVKCPAPNTHIGYMLARGVDEKYRPQVQGQLYVTERDWDDTQSYCPAFPSVIVRAGRDEKYISVLHNALQEFIDRLLAAREELTRKYGVTGKVLARDEHSENGMGITDADVEMIVRAKFPEVRV